MSGQYEYVVWYQFGDDENNRSYYHVDADNWQEAEDKTLALGDAVNVIAVYQRATTDAED